MVKANSKDTREILQIENRILSSRELVDHALKAYAKAKTEKNEWWKEVVKKYHLDKGRYYRVWIDGEILEERRKI